MKVHSYALAWLSAAASASNIAHVSAKSAPQGKLRVISARDTATAPLKDMAAASKNLKLNTADLKNYDAKDQRMLSSMDRKLEVTYASARYVRFQMTEENFITFKEVQVIDSAGNNIALNKNATSSSEYSSSEDASKAVDGDLGTHFSSQNVSGTLGHWEVDLGAVVNDIVYVKIYNSDGWSSECLYCDRLNNANIILKDGDGNIIPDYTTNVGDMSQVHERAFPVGYSNSDILWTIALGESSLTTDFSSDNTSENLKLKYRIGRGREAYDHSVYASCDTMEAITNLDEGTDYNVTALPTLPTLLATKGVCLDASGNAYTHIASRTKEAPGGNPNEDFPFPSTKEGCLQFCAILPDQGNQVGLWMKFEGNQRDTPDNCVCLYHKGSLPALNSIPTYASRGGVSLPGTGAIDSVNSNGGFDCYSFEGVNTGLDTLELKYTFDKSKIVNSNIWNSTDSHVEFCQTTQLTIAGPGNEPMVISEDKRTVNIAFDLDAEFSLAGDNDIDLEGATILAENRNTTLSDYISAYKCDSIGTPSTTNLAPNNELSVCIKSSSSDVQIQAVQSMIIKGTDPDDNLPEELAVMENGGPKFDAITSFNIVNEGANPEAVVRTMVPANLFNYEAENASIDVSGTVILKLAGTQRKLLLGGSSRLLQAGDESNLFDANEESAAFDLKIDLESEDTEQLDGAMMNAAEGYAGKALAIIGMAIASTYALW